MGKAMPRSGRKGRLTVDRKGILQKRKNGPSFNILREIPLSTERRKKGGLLYLNFTKYEGKPDPGRPISQQQLR